MNIDRRTLSKYFTTILSHYHFNSWHFPYTMCGAGSMHLLGVRPSVRRLSQDGPTAASPLVQVCCCGPGWQDISIDCCTAHCRVEYFDSFLTEVVSAALPAEWDVECRCESAGVLTTVTFHVRGLPPCHGINASPSGRLPSSTNKQTDGRTRPIAGPH